MDFLAWARANFPSVQPSGENVTVNCPFHEDETPSLSIHAKTGQFQCFACDAKGGFRALCRRMKVKLPSWYRDPRLGAIARLPDSYVAAVDRGHDSLMMNDEILARLREEWGVDEKTMMKFRLGWDRKAGRLLIPIYWREALVDIRKYKFDAAANKVTRVAGVKVVYLFPEFNLYENELIYVEGEKDAIIGTHHGIPCISPTGGAKRVPPSQILERLTKKTIVVCFDVDEQGRRGATRHAKSIGEHAELVRLAELPAAELPPNGDLADYLKDHDAEAFKELCRSARQLWPQVARDRKLGDEVYDIGLAASRTPAYLMKRCRVVTRCIGKHFTPYTFPYKGEISCTPGQCGKACVGCQMETSGGTLRFELRELEDPRILDLVKCTDGEQRKALAVMLDVQCHKWEWVEQDNRNLEHVIVTQDPQAADYDEAPEQHEAYVVGIVSLQQNLTYRFTGRQVAHPRDQQVTHLFSECEELNGLVFLRDGQPVDDYAVVDELGLDGNKG